MAAPNTLASIRPLEHASLTCSRSCAVELDCLMRPRTDDALLLRPAVSPCEGEADVFRIGEKLDPHFPAEARLDCSEISVMFNLFLRIATGSCSGRELLCMVHMSMAPNNTARPRGENCEHLGHLIRRQQGRSRISADAETAEQQAAPATWRDLGRSFKKSVGISACHTICVLGHRPRVRRLSWC